LAFCPRRLPARRLNRYEYDATIRDLLGVDFRAGDDFPADNFSYGFDNNAGTLTVTPALAAKYLEAARKISRAAIEPIPPPSTPQLERYSNPSASPDLTWQRHFIWDGDYDLHISLAGRHDPFALYVSLDDREPQPLQVSFDFEGRRYAETRLYVTTGAHRLRFLSVRDDGRTMDEAWAFEVLCAKKAGSEPLSRSEIRTRLMAATLPDPRWPRQLRQLFKNQFVA
jgi:hypothetical protein